MSEDLRLLEEKYKIALSIKDYKKVKEYLLKINEQKQFNSQRKKDKHEGSNDVYLETRNITGEEIKDEHMPVNMDNHSGKSFKEEIE